MNSIREFSRFPEVNNYYKSGEIPERIGINASRYFNITVGEEIFSIYDDTIFGSCKNGFAICESGIYWRNLMSNPMYISWNKYKDLDLDADIGQGRIFIGNNYIDVFRAGLEQIVATLALIKLAVESEKIILSVEEYEEFLNECASIIMDDEENNSTSSKVENEDTNLESDNDWMICVKGEVFGPYNINGIIKWLERNPNDINSVYVWKAGMNEWELITNITVFKKLIIEHNNMPNPPKF